MKPVSGLMLGGRYRLVSRIAVGGMGEVWVGEDLSIGRSVAVKVLREEYAGHEEFLVRLRTEARNSSVLSHPNIAETFDYGEENDTGYLVMELVEGEPLADLLERHPIIELRTLLPILAQTARALNSAHAAGVVHRDIKPGNILLDRSGEVKITDFGVSTATNQVPMTATGMVMGTAQYLSPEQAIGQAATGASDVYALGIVAYESVVGRRPFTGPTPVDIAIAHVNDAVPPLPAHVDEELAALIMAMLSKDPRKRPHPAEALARLIDRIAERLVGPGSGAHVILPEPAPAPPPDVPVAVRRSRHAREDLDPVAAVITPIVIPAAMRRARPRRAAEPFDDSTMGRTRTAVNPTVDPSSSAAETALLAPPPAAIEQVPADTTEPRYRANVAESRYGANTPEPRYGVEPRYAADVADTAVYATDPRSGADAVDPRYAADAAAWYAPVGGADSAEPEPIGYGPYAGPGELDGPAVEARTRPPSPVDARGDDRYPVRKPARAPYPIDALAGDPYATAPYAVAPFGRGSVWPPDDASPPALPAGMSPADGPAPIPGSSRDYPSRRDIHARPEPPGGPAAAQSVAVRRGTAPGAEPAGTRAGRRAQETADRPSRAAPVRVRRADPARARRAEPTRARRAEPSRSTGAGLGTAWGRLGSFTGRRGAPPASGGRSGGRVSGGGRVAGGRAANSPALSDRTRGSTAPADTTRRVPDDHTRRAATAARRRRQRPLLGLPWPLLALLALLLVILIVTIVSRSMGSADAMQHGIGRSPHSAIVTTSLPPKMDPAAPGGMMAPVPWSDASTATRH